METKIDYRKELKELYRPSPKTPSLVEVPTMNFLMVDGREDPNTSQEFEDAHHEIYLSDPRRADPKKMKTIIRHPVSPR